MAAAALALASAALPLAVNAPQAQAAAAQEVVLPPITGNVKLVGLTLYRGFLNRVVRSSDQLDVYKTNVGIGAAPVAGTTTGLGFIPPTWKTPSCSAAVECVRLVEGNESGLAHLIEENGRTYLMLGVGSSLMLPIPGRGGQVRDASGDYAVVDGGSPRTQYIVSSSGSPNVLRSRPVQAAALWYSTLWSASASSPGTLTAERLTPSVTTPGKPVRTVKTGVACVPTELQATNHWLYWSCGDGKRAGVYDLARNRGFAVPSGPSMLGDGYVVRNDRTAHELKLTDFHTGAPAAERRIGDLPPSGLPDESRITWAVDKYSGHIAWVDGEHYVHVRADGVPNSAPVIGDAVLPTIIEPRVLTWYSHRWLSRPVDSWELGISSKVTGRRVATFRGGAARGDEPISAFWNGKEPNGAFAPSGPYVWNLTVKYDGRTSATQVGSGTVPVWCGRLLTHVYDCDGIPDLLGIRTDGRTYSWAGLSKGTLRNDGWIATWPTSSLLVPIGDLNGDGNADLLVRNSKGAVRAYWGRGYSEFSPTLKSTAITTGWNRYNVLTSPGDLTGDGRDDLVARDTAGVLWLYPANGRSGYGTRIKIGYGQGGYTAMVGVGDLNGDGRGDLVARDAAGNLYRMLGANGRFGPRAKIGAGWNTYNAIIGIGDINQDGKNDLLTRDAAGNLYRYSGNGKGAISPRVKIGSGWNTYKKLV
ncbi:hypothetical protein GCM10023193_78110 [Planotetraspora kaengkrachanensis]|uniref:Repeat domain-containing protein n=1 Tax=Planotetraspora kaengkrachanensis TaxID=575193 RepID=A0A8J3VCL3_9ACTN|nr:hypothetical protein Pka01_77260 [Planotetraspora kaengkrachanensis]